MVQDGALSQDRSYVRDKFTLLRQKVSLPELQCISGRDQVPLDEAFNSQSYKDFAMGTSTNASAYHPSELFLGGGEVNVPKSLHLCRALTTTSRLTRLGRLQLLQHVQRFDRRCHGLSISAEDAHVGGRYSCPTII